jgi:hypothetical protein
MKINLSEGTIDAHTFTLTAGKASVEFENGITGGANKTIFIDT